MRNIKPLYYLYQAYKFLVYAPVITTSTMAVTLVLFASSFLFGEKYGASIGRFWGKLNSYAVPMPVKLEGEHNVKPGQSYIVTANHQSLLDITALYGWLPLDFRWVMKKELRSVPFLGYYCYVAGHVFIERKAPEAAIRSINEAKQKITGGVSILFFPEGTRSNDGQLMEFKKGAFKFAQDLGLPILPVTINGSKNALPNNTIDLFPAHCTVTIHKPIEVDEINNMTMDELISSTKKIIASNLASS